MINLDEIKSLNSKELLDKLYGKELNTKKNILEYIELTRVLKEEGTPKELIDGTYNLISDSIDNMKVNAKPNTIMFLKNQLKGQLGRLATAKKENKDEMSFIKFFKEAYPEGKRNRNFTYVLMDDSKISAEQIWTTLTYINRKCIKGNLTLTNEQKKDIIYMIEKLVNKKDIKYINQVKSMNSFLKILNIKIVEVNNEFGVKEYR